MTRPSGLGPWSTLGHRLKYWVAYKRATSIKLHLEVQPGIDHEEHSGQSMRAITCDIVGSRKIDEFRRKRDQKLRGISRLHVQKKWILSDYAITAWDEFEGILSRPANLPAVLVDLRRHFHPFELWIGIGMGEVTEPHRKPVNIFAGGEAFCSGHARRSTN